MLQTRSSVFCFYTGNPLTAGYFINCVLLFEKNGMQLIIDMDIYKDTVIDCNHSYFKIFVELLFLIFHFFAYYVAEKHVLHKYKNCTFAISIF